MPAAKLKISEWADEYAYLSPESSHQSGRWKCLPYQVEPLNCFIDSSVEMVTMMKSARVGYTKILNQIIGYHMSHDPKSMLIVQPTVEDAQGYSKDELQPMIRDTPTLEGLISDPRSREQTNTILKKNYPGGFMALVGSNSPRGFRRISVPLVLMDEIDGYSPSAGNEGDQIKLAEKRTEWFWDKKIALGSTPTIKGISRVEHYFNRSDQRYYYVPCPFCGEMQTIEFRNLKWPKGEPEKAALECIKCGELIPHSKKRVMVEQGEWRATKPFKGHAGFHIWAGYSLAPNATWGHIASEFLACKDDPELLKTYKNTTLGQTWEEQGDQPDWAILKARCEPYEFLTVPGDGLMLTAGVDVQDNRLAVVIRAWGKQEESWLVYWTEIYGDTAQPEVWGELDQLIDRSFKHESGADLMIMSAAIDSGGHNTQAVYNFARARSPRVISIKGSSQAGRPVIGKPTNQDVTWMGSRIKGGVQLWQIGTDTAKSTIYSRLRRSTFGPGAYHWPAGLDDEYFMQLTAEKQITRYKRGYPVLEWVKTGPRNEVLDCEVYAYAAALRAGIVHIDWESLRRTINIKQPPTSNRPMAQTNNWIQKKEGWLK